MKLIRELNEEVSYLKEDKDGKKSYFIEGPYLQADIFNKNKRRYRLDVMEPEVERYIKENVNRRRAFGELGHPSSPTINLDRASHLIIELKRSGSNFIGRSEVLDTPMGKIVQSLIESNCTLAVSSRGLGTLVPVMSAEGMMDVQKDFRLATAADIVADPSAPDAFVQGVMESADWVFVEGSGWVQEHAEQLRSTMRKETTREISEQKFVRFQQFLDTLVRR